jgi:hypothetical protein
LKHKIAKLIAFLLFAGSIGYIMGQAGLSDLGEISIGQCVIRVGGGLVVLGIGALVANYSGKEEAHADSSNG